MTKTSTSTISKIVAFSLATTAITLMSAQSATAATLGVDFTKLDGFILSDPNSTPTGVFRADLSNLDFDITAILIADANTKGGLPGQFSGFDLDAIKLSTSLIDNAADINSIVGLNVFDFSPANTVFAPGVQRAPTDPVLFGTTGANIDNLVATLDSFDGIATDQVQSGFVSLGDAGQVQFNLTSAIAQNTPLYLYIGEVGNNEQVAQASITLVGEPTPPDPVSVPEPTSLAALSLMGIYFAARRKQTAKPA